MRFVHLLLMTAGVTCGAGCNSAAKDAPLPATPVRVAVATAGPAAPSIRTNGVLANRDEIRLAFKVGGVIKRLAVSEGELVHRGQKLAEIEQTEVNAQVEQARQARDKANRDVARGERLYADKVISLEQLQDLRTQAAMAEAALGAAQFNWSYAAIVAPRDGTVLRRLAEEREVVAAGAPVLVLGAQDRGFVVRTGLADREIVQVSIGDAVHVRLDALPEAKLDGKVTEIASAADRASGMFGVEVAIADREHLPLKSGLVAKLTLVPSSASSGSRVYVPIGSIVEGNGRNARLFVLDKDRARSRQIEVAFIEGGIVALAGGVDAGEQVITDGALYLEDGERVAIFKSPVPEKNGKTRATAAPARSAQL
jgi:RND family efflux transporter MFP subunit